MRFSPKASGVRKEQWDEQAQVSVILGLSCVPALVGDCGPQGPWRLAIRSCEARGTSSL